MATGSFSAFLVSWRVELSEKEDDSQRERINDEGDVTRRKEDSIVTLLLLSRLLVVNMHVPD
jgi:hypothetical protein